MPDGKVEKHESFGLIEFHRIQSSKADNLFGSSIKHRNMIRLTISRGERERTLNQDWYFGRELLLEADMSATQFAEAITTMNSGPGIPITLRQVGRSRMEDPPVNQVRQEFQNEFDKDMKGLAQSTTDALKTATALRSKQSGITKKEMEDLVHKLEMLKQEIESNIPFVRNQFNRQVDKSVAEAKGEIDAAVTHAVYSTGLKTLRDQAPLMIEGESNDSKS